MSLRVSHSRASQSAILHERGWRRYEAHSPAGQLSIKCMFGGAAYYETRFGRYRVDDARYLILNHGTPYSITIDEPQRIESFCIFFAPGFVEDALRAHVTAEDRLLDQPETVPDATFAFFEHTYTHDGTLTPALLRLRTASATGRGEPLAARASQRAPRSREDSCSASCHAR